MAAINPLQNTLLEHDQILILEPSGFKAQCLPTLCLRTEVRQEKLQVLYIVLLNKDASTRVMIRQFNPAEIKVNKIVPGKPCFFFFFFF